MQFQLSYVLPEPVSLPMGHHEVIQGYLYRILNAVPEYSELLHDVGYTDGTRSYKLFVYGPLEGPYEIRNRTITFRDAVCLEVRSPMPDFCDIFMQAVMHAEHHELNRQELILQSCTMRRDLIHSDSVEIQMKSPLCLSTTEYIEGEKKTVYYRPEEPAFYEQVGENFRNKLMAATRQETDEEISLLPVRVSERDKYVTRFKGIYITAWKGIYRLSGSPQALSFLYDCGLGSRNAQGFGMFDLRKKHVCEESEFCL